MSEAARRAALEALQARMRACRLCLEAGHDILPGAVFSGVISARVMVIGQAPGITEHRIGRPFNAGSGSRLFRWLEQAGFDETELRRTQYLTAVTKCYPGRAPGGGDRVPSRQEQQLCRPYLEQEIALIDPALIIPVGRLAISLFFPAGVSLTQIIGVEKRIDGRWVIPLPHPSGASRWHQLPENRRQIEAALRRIRKRWRQVTA
ncbi:MAG: uracil-DNA glycosylase family protein [Chloroflexota bacterium]